METWISAATGPTEPASSACGLALLALQLGASGAKLLPGRVHTGLAAREDPVFNCTACVFTRSIRKPWAGKSLAANMRHRHRGRRDCPSPNQMDDDKAGLPGTDR